MLIEDLLLLKSIVLTILLVSFTFLSEYINLPVRIGSNQYYDAILIPSLLIMTIVSTDTIFYRNRVKYFDTVSISNLRIQIANNPFITLARILEKGILFSLMPLLVYIITIFHTIKPKTDIIKETTWEKYVSLIFLGIVGLIIFYFTIRRFYKLIIRIKHI